MFIHYLLTVSGTEANFELNDSPCDVFLHPSECRWIVPGTLDVDYEDSREWY